MRYAALGVFVALAAMGTLFFFFPMETLRLGAALLLAMFAALIITFPLWKPFVLKKMADRNFFITSVEENTAKVIEEFGEFHHMVISKRGHYLTTKGDVIKEGSPEANEPDNGRAPEHRLDKFLPGGLRWVGLPFQRKVHEYHFQWTSLRQGKIGPEKDTPRGKVAIVQQKDLEDLLISRDETLDYFFLGDDIYCINFKDTDDKERIPLSFIALLTARIENPVLAAYAPEQWLEQVTNFLRRYIKEYVGNKTLAELVSDAKGTKEESDNILKCETTEGPDVKTLIRERWGVKILHINLVNFQTSGKRGEAYETAAATEYVKEQEAKGIVKIAHAEAERITIVTKAITDGGDTSLVLRGIEALETIGEEGNTVLVGGEQPISMLLNAAQAKIPTFKGPQGGSK